MCSRSSFSGRWWHLFEATSELVAHGGVDERVGGAAAEAGPVSGEHREEELGVTQEADGLQLGDRRHGVERRPTEHERQRNQDDHSRYLHRRRHITHHIIIIIIIIIVITYIYSTVKHIK